MELLSVHLFDRCSAVESRHTSFLPPEGACASLMLHEDLKMKMTSHKQDV